jgi:hypothetical protein
VLIAAALLSSLRRRGAPKMRVKLGRRKVKPGVKKANPQPLQRRSVSGSDVQVQPSQTRSFANERTPPHPDGVKFGRRRHNRRRAARRIMPRFGDFVSPSYWSPFARLFELIRRGADPGDKIRQATLPSPKGGRAVPCRRLKLSGRSSDALAHDGGSLW